MKRTRFLLTTIAAAAVAAVTFTACEKTSDKPADTQPAQPGATGKAADPAKPGEPSKPAPAAVQISAADIDKISATYGFVAKLPKDVEAFSATYRLHDLWLSVANSKWAATLLSIPQIKESKEYAQFQEGVWNNPKAAQVKEILAEVLGQETTFAAPAGFTTSLKPWVDFLGVYYSTAIEAYASMALSGGRNPQRMQQMIRDAAPRFIPYLSKCDAPPMLLAFKAGKIRPLVDDSVEKLKELVKTFPPLEMGSFKVGDTEFTSVTVTVKKLMAQFQAVQLELQLKEALGDEKQAKAVVDAIDAKKFEIAWAWMGDHLVVSLGSDHNHVKFAANAAESALANPVVGARAAQFADKKPNGITYVSKSIQDAFAMNFNFADAFKTYAEELGGILKPEQISGMVTDVKSLEGQAKSLFTTTYDSLVQIDYAEGGYHSEVFGGARNKSIDSSKPLSLASLATPASFIFLNGRSNAAYSKAVLDFVESGASTVWGWYEKYGRTMVPESERQGFAFAEATVLPLLKEFWKSSRTLGNALGDESAFIFDTAGAVPKLPNMPPWVAEGKMPRIAWVATVKDRAGIAEAWKGYSSIIKQIVPFIPEGYPVPEPQTKTEGDVETHFVPLPVPTDDLLPHIAITKDRWMLSTSPSFSKELAAKPAAAGGQPLGAHAALNVSALLDHAEAWLKVLDKNTGELPDAQSYKQARPLIDTIIKLARSFQGVEAKVSDEGGEARQSIHLKLQDVK